MELRDKKLITSTPSLCLVMLLALKSTLSEMSESHPILLVRICTLYFLHGFIFNFSVSLYLRHISHKQNIGGGFFPQCDNFRLLIGISSTFKSNCWHILVYIYHIAILLPGFYLILFLSFIAFFLD